MSYIHIPKWGQSSTGEWISLFHSQTPLVKPILFIGGVHGDEPEGVQLAVDLLTWLKNHKSTNELNPWALIPCLNPDGYRLRQRGNANHVDLNRNYPSKNWAPLEKGASPRYHPGSEPGSEPEIQALVNLIHLIKPEIIIHFHSWNPCIVMSGNFEKPYAEFLSNSSGYEIQSEIGYETPGALSQFAWKDLKIPVICIEEKEHIDLNLVWPHFKEGLEKILTYKVQKSPE